MWHRRSVQCAYVAHLMLVAEMLGDGRRENCAGVVARGGGWESRRYVAVMEVAVKKTKAKKRAKGIEIAGKDRVDNKNALLD